MIPRPIIEDKPALQAAALTHYMGDRLRAGSIDIHSAFQLNHEAVRIRRLCYRQPAWGHSLYISGLYSMFMHALTARALRCDEQMKIAEDWFLEDLPLLREKRKHPLVDRLEQGRALFYDHDFLQLLADTRRMYHERTLDEELGPYHVTVFPYDYAVPEQELLFPGTCSEFDRTIPLDSEIEAILVELLTGVWS
ncbi:MAG: hypothetical protein QOD03_1140 [Verrucomicrobiota bacterium]|jgi:hypothetical protein